MLLRIFRVVQMVPNQIATCPARFSGCFAKRQVSARASCKRPCSNEFEDKFNQLSGGCRGALQERYLSVKPLADGNRANSISGSVATVAYSSELMSSSLRTHQHFQLVLFPGGSSKNNCLYSSALVSSTSLRFVTSRISHPTLKNYSVVRPAEQNITLRQKREIPAMKRDMYWQPLRFGTCGFLRNLIMCCGYRLLPRLLVLQGKKHSDADIGHYGNYTLFIFNLHQVCYEKHFEKMQSERQHISSEVATVCSQVSNRLQMIIAICRRRAMGTEKILIKLVARIDPPTFRLKLAQLLTDGATLQKLREPCKLELMAPVDIHGHVKQSNVQRDAEERFEHKEENDASTKDQPARKRRRGRRGKGRRNRDRQGDLGSDSVVNAQKSNDTSTSCKNPEGLSCFKTERNKNSKCGDVNAQIHGGSANSQKEKTGANERQFKNRYINKHFPQKPNIVNLSENGKRRVKCAPCNALKSSCGCKQSDCTLHSYERQDQRGDIKNGQVVIDDKTEQGGIGENGKNEKQIPRSQTLLTSPSKTNPQPSPQVSSRTDCSNGKSQSLECDNNGQAVKDEFTAAAAADEKSTENKRRKRCGRRHSGNNQETIQSSSMTPKSLEDDPHDQIGDNNIQHKQANEVNDGSGKKENAEDVDVDARTIQTQRLPAQCRKKTGRDTSHQRLSAEKIYEYVTPL